MLLRVDSEIGRLRRVLVHRPGREIDWMVPRMIEHLLFDDILDGDQARGEHDAFRGILELVGAEALDAEELLGEVLAAPGPREEVLAEIGASYAVPAEARQRLTDLPARELARALVAGVRAPATGRKRDFFDLPPVPNYFFQRDPQVVIGDRVIISSMATEAREREPLLARALFTFHPALAGYRGCFDIDHPPAGDPAHDPAYTYPTLEGGDVVIAAPDTLLVGMSERTNRRGVEILAEHLRSENTPFRHLILVELPSRRSYMHLDTVFTFIDRGTCLAYLPVVEPGHPESARAYRVGLESPTLSFTVMPSLLAALAEVGIEPELVACGGTADPIDQEREQWTDGANAFAVAPGLILLYRRNRRTVEELAGRGWRVLAEEEVLAARTDLLAAAPAVVTIQGTELSRARGGPRCMTMPLERDPA